MTIRYYWYEDVDDNTKGIAQIICDKDEEDSSFSFDYYIFWDDCPLESFGFKTRYKLLERIMNQNRTIRLYHSRIKVLKREYRRVSILLRSAKRTKEACEDAGYLIYYPSLLSKIEGFADTKRIVLKDIKVYTKLLKGELKNVSSV